MPGTPYSAQVLVSSDRQFVVKKFHDICPEDPDRYRIEDEEEEYREQLEKEHAEKTHKSNAA